MEQSNFPAKPSTRIHCVSLHAELLKNIILLCFVMAFVDLHVLTQSVFYFLACVSGLFVAITTGVNRVRYIAKSYS